MGAPNPQAQFLPRTITLGLMPMDRKAIERQIDALIDLLDQIDGDPDMEPDHEDYDPCDFGERREFMATVPIYGIDQSEGPLNAELAWEIHYEASCGVKVDHAPH